MKGKIMALLLALSLLLSGCGLLDGSYLSKTPHREQRQSQLPDTMSASNYEELMTALEEMVSHGSENATINVESYPSGAVKSGMAIAINHAKHTYPIGAYAVEDIRYELGSSGGKPAVAVSISYRVEPSQIRNIRRMGNVGAADKVVGEALERYDTGVVMLLEHYRETDFTQLVRDYTEEHPQSVMETPQVTENVYGHGTSRVVELTLIYQNSREDLRKMHNQVEPVFSAAAMYVSGDGSDRLKYSQLYAFLMERFDYTVETSITPAYSLLCHGVGDSRAFATVYAAMCRASGLDCQIVTGTCAGEPRTWNIVSENGYDYHVDLIRCNELGGYRVFTDGDMQGYVWDYSAYPACVGAPVEAAQPEDETANGEDVLEAWTNDGETSSVEKME